MKRLWLVIMTASVLVAVVTGCGGAGRYDARLVAADSLMQPDPDSALALVLAVPRDSLTREGDRAYRDLLLTQARYKCYITATSDSDINRALDYYRRHSGEREKLTRAYIYKGAVMEELGHPDSAMFYYKHAEATAAPDDYFNLGYVNLRMGALYSDYYAYDGIGISKYETALGYYNRINAVEYRHKCLNNLGCLYRATHPQKSEKLLKEALEMSQQANDTNGIITDSYALIVLYSYHKNFDQARHLVQSINNQFDKTLDVSYYTSAANVYSGLGRPDSASFFLNLAKKTGIKNDEDKIYYLESLSKLAYACNDTISYMRLQNQSNHISDSIQKHSKKLLISKAEIDYDFFTQNKKAFKQQRVKLFIYLISCIVLIAFLTLVNIYTRRLKGHQQLIKELKNESESQLKALGHLEQNINKLKIGDKQIKEFVNKQLDMLREITVACYHEPRNRLGKQVKSILQFSEHNQDNWVGLYDYIDAEYNGIMLKTRIRFPQLNQKDLLLIALTCLEFSYIQIAIIMGYSNHTSIGTLKHRLAEKMELDGTLNDYIHSFNLP